MSIRKNKGEWSEFYVLTFLLSQGKLYAADSHLNRIENMFFPVDKIIRDEEQNKHVEYVIHKDDIDVVDDYQNINTIKKSQLVIISRYLYERIKEGGKSAFSIDHSEEFMKELNCTKVTAPSTDKTDITLQIHDINTGYNPVCGFSIKSELGHPPTLLNAGKTTNFIYKVSGISANQMEMINSISTRTKINDRIKAIQDHGSISFERAANNTFASNLMMIDTRMEEIIGWLLLEYYGTNIKKCDELIHNIEESNPLHFPRSGLYEYKFRKFLCSVALGMVPSKEWDGKEEANGGYIIVTSDGDVVAYHMYNRDEFETYLLTNTKLEKASTSRHNFASLYIQGDEMYINLNLQIRFI